MPPGGWPPFDCLRISASTRPWPATRRPLRSKHLCPSMLAEELAKLERSAEIYITHLKPGEIELTMQEIEEDAGQYRPRMLQNNQVFEF